MKNKVNRKFKKRVLKESKQLILSALNDGILTESFKGISVTFHKDKVPQYKSYTVDELNKILENTKDLKGQRVFYKKEREAVIQLVSTLFPDQVYLFQQSVEVKKDGGDL